MYPRDSITLVEVGPRDGLQYESRFFPTEKKIELINLLAETGLTRLEITSFVHPQVIPQFKDTMEVVEGITYRPGVRYSALVPNVKGCQRAIATPLDELTLFVSASETHNKKNVNMTVDESLKALSQVSQMALKAGKRLRGAVVTAFGCPYEGRVPLKQVLRIIKAYAEMGLAEVFLGDTTGMANPRQVVETFEAVIEAAGPMDVAAHFHNSRGTGLANALAAFQAGVRIFDSSVGGIGGCPTAIGAMGNIATEELVNMMEEMGVATGVDLDKLLEAARFAQEVIGAELPSYVLKSGRPNWEGMSEEKPD
ncbi:MAG: hydroxymethylglutaryl-CoA lyase [Deltaproteobacteria bacterium]|nr:hydroxymethylglutaryl-CoA lyase [Deltaproteobacteria bacterium]